MYDTTAFNFTMMYGLPAVTALLHIDKNLVTLGALLFKYCKVNDNAIIWAVDGDDDRSVAFAARLLDQMFKYESLIKNPYFQVTSYLEGVLLLLLWITQTM